MPSRTALYNDPSAPSDSAYLSSSLSSLSRSRSSNNLIVRTYKQATQLYLTRRFREAWDVLETIVNAGSQDDEENDGQNHGIAPVAQSSRGTRTKVWVFYLSLIHAVVEMGAEDGAREFGGADAWRAVARKAREGLAWEEIVAEGMLGRKGKWTQKLWSIWLLCCWDICPIREPIRLGWRVTWRVVRMLALLRVTMMG
jgi:hypothetical protein